MIYELEFLPSALKEWKKLGGNVRFDFQKKLRERLRNPRVASAKLSGLPDCYKIKLKSAGYRLVYRVLGDKLIVQVVAVGRRDKSSVYKNASNRVN